VSAARRLRDGERCADRSTAARARLVPRPRPRTLRATGSPLHARRRRSCRGAVEHRDDDLQTRLHEDGPAARVGDAPREAREHEGGDTGSPHQYEYDHLISLELGGAPSDARNLWPEPGTSPNPKDRLENRLHRMVCDGAISLSAAQCQIATDWVRSYRRVFG
jgi:hypothetical protein